MKQAKDRKELEIIGYLNENRLFGGSRYYDCPTLGTLHIWWWRGWNTEWITVEKWPIDFPPEKE